MPTPAIQPTRPHVVTAPARATALMPMLLVMPIAGEAATTRATVQRRATMILARATTATPWRRGRTGKTRDTTIKPGEDAGSPTRSGAPDMAPRLALHDDHLSGMIGSIT